MPRYAKIILIALASIMALSLAFSAGCTIKSGPDIGLLNEAWTIITKNYVVPSKVDPNMLNEGAARGMVEALNDPYSAYLTANEYKLTQGNLQGSFSGIGAQVGLNKDNQPVILSPMENLPAAIAGTKTGDVILAVNGKSTQGLGLTQTVMLIRGPEGTTVKLLVLHQGDAQPVEIAIIRAQITSSSVVYKMMQNVAYIGISGFNENTNDELNTILQTIKSTNATGIILDLRDNPGGMVTSVLNVSSHFIKQDIIATLVDNKGNRSTQLIKPNAIFTDLPMVVLVNQFSASASEILSGALQDYKRATIAGTVTLGKGSYDSFFQLSNGSAIYLTIGRWVTPLGREIEGKGITPDFILKETGDQEVQWAVDFLTKPR